MALSKRDKIKLRDAQLIAEKRNDSDSWEFLIDCITDLKLGIMSGRNEGDQQDICELLNQWRSALKKWLKMQEV